jgi:hypothetical protein
MKLLFLLYDFNPHDNENSIIMNDLAEAFTESGHEVHILPFKASFDSVKEEEWNRLHIHRITQTFDKRQLYIFLLKHRYISATKLAVALYKDKHNRKAYSSASWSYFSYNRFIDILKTYDIDIVINVCYPFEACLPVIKYLKSNKNTFRWIIYMLDPFESNYLGKCSKEEFLQLKAQVFGRADKIILTRPMMNELIGTLKEEAREKYQFLNLPKIIKPYRKFADDNILFDRRYINCVFVGKFDEETRNPRFLLRLFYELRKEPILLHIIGEEREKWSDCLPEESYNIIFYGSKSKEAAINAELNANFLINLADRIKNQLPIKLLEYISTGKPIINLYQLENCETLCFMEHYPLHINICEYNFDHYIALRCLRHFIRRYRHANINYRYIYRNFYYCTLQYVSCEFLNLFDELMEDTR